MSLQPGTRIGAYEIVASLGAGGMGEVYRARDPRLKRDVAIKVLGADVTGDPDRLARFAREARILAGLNHTNIAHVYGVEEAAAGAALVMELVSGRTLAEVLRAPTLAMTEALAIARQIAEALEAAHDAGVIHRDLKPANVMVRPDGVVKVLDFGLATTAADTAGPEHDTVTSPVLTARGVILGTAAYMSPEQAKGLALDRRTDIWSFGVVLLELLSGRRLFQGNTVGEIAASVIKDPIDFGRLPAETPQRVRTLLARCLEREPRLRLRDIGEARVALSAAAQEPGGATSSAVRTQAPSRGIWLALLGAVAVLGAVAGWTLRPGNGDPPASSLVLPLGGDLQFEGFTGPVAVSPDGRSIAYSAMTGVGASQIAVGSSDLYLRRLDGSNVEHLGSGNNPFWSPDGQWIGFSRAGRLHKVAATGGPSSELGPANVNDRAFWAPTNTILAGYPTDGTASIGIRRFSMDAGEPHILTTPDHSRGETHHLSPQVVSGGQAVLYTVRSEGLKFRLDVKPLAGGPARTILDDAAFGRYLGDGLLLYQRGTKLFVARVDPSTLVVSDSAPVVENVADGLSAPTWSFAAGTLVYRPREDAGRALLWVSRDGRAESTGAPVAGFSSPKVSPDGRRIALMTADGPATNVSVFDGGRLQQVTTDGQSRAPLWSADGRLFVQRRAAANDIYLVNTDGTGQPKQITTDGYSQGAAFATPDGKSLVFHHLVPGGPTGYDLWLADLTGTSPPRPLLESPDLEAGARLHPTGGWIAYAMIRARRDEVWIASYPDLTLKVFVSGEGSREPVWSRDGRELFFRNGTKMYSVPFRPESAEVIGQPKVLFDTPFYQTGGPGNTQYDVGADGRFLMMLEPERQLPHWVLMQGWTAKLKAALNGGK